ncbi:MAG TPA: dTDP-4-dehydrorhamnose reductase [Thermoplasmata archaeon]|nr:dTDP-4-dehydrorhamnose reductase [Thermoplasmata archaeon]
MRILVVGAAGQVGGKVAAQAAGRGDEVWGTYRSRPPAIPGVEPAILDKTDRAAVAALVSQIRPDAVVDTGALHNVDYCETHPDEAFRVNRDGSRHLAEASRDVGARFAFVSTDFVFDGAGSPPYAESDAPHPLSVYGESKLAGERAVLDAYPDAVVARPSVVFSWVPPGATGPSTSGKPLNFASWLVHEARLGHPLRIVQDQVASPTLADDLATALLDLLPSAATGTFHAAGATPISRFDFAERLLAVAHLPRGTLTPIATSDLRQVAKRPLNSSLRSDRIAREAGHRMLDLEGAIERFGRAMAATPGPPAPG